MKWWESNRRIRRINWSAVSCITLVFLLFAGLVGAIVVDASIEGPPILIAFNVRFLREALDVIKTPNVALETTADTSPGMLRPVGDSDFLHVIMPMHLGS